jgi:predicted DNA-binding transcriptional regulator AlpA
MNPGKKERRMKTKEKLVTRRQAAELLGVREQTLAVWQTTNRYDLPIVKIGAKSVRYRLSDLRTFAGSPDLGEEE